jgi:AraC family transcriptional regulator of adaptative response/methylated-DNA-[protein]-cysteine methyltransferase
MQTLVEQRNKMTNQTDYNLVAEAIVFLERNYQQQPTLDELAAHLHLSPFHLQRLFTRWAGVSPKRFVQYLTASHAKTLLTNAHSVLDATYGSGLSSPGRLHDLMIATEAVTPGEFKRQGIGITIAYGRHATSFGDALVAVTERGICALSFIDDAVPARSWQSAVDDLRRRWQAATLVEDATRSAPFAQAAFNQGERQQATPVPLLLKGTNFQLKVWEALLRIPAGAAWSYVDVAKAIGQPSAARAVGNAVGANPIGYLIPCHRVIRQSGIIDGYHWGTTRKKAILAWEAAQGNGERQVA